MPSIKQNFIYNTLLQIMQIILPFVTAPYIARVLGAELVGIYSYTAAIAGYFVVFTLIGSGQSLRQTSAVRNDRNELNHEFSNIFYIHLAASFIIALIYYCFVAFYSSEYKVLLLIEGLTVFAAAFQINGLYAGLENSRAISIRSIIVKLISLIMIFTFIKSKDDFMTYVWITVLSNVLSISTLWFGVKKYITFVKPSIFYIKSNIKECFSLFICNLSISSAYMVDRIMIGAFSPTVQVGYYENAYKIINIIFILSASLDYVFMPRSMNLIATNRKEQAIKNFNLVFKYSFLILSPLCFGIASIAKEFAVIFYGAEFAPTGDILPIMALAVPFLAISSIIRSQYLAGHKKDKIMLLSLFISMIINIALNIILIPRYGAWGAALATIGAELFCVVYCICFIKKDVPILKCLKSAIPFLLIGSLMFAVVMVLNLLLRASLLSLFLKIFIGSLIYISLCLLYLYRKRDELICNIIIKLRRKAKV